MSTFSTNSIIISIKNEKLYRTPKSIVGSLLISWGVLSGHFQSDGTFKTTKFYRNHQIFVMVFMWSFVIRYAISIFSIKPMLISIILETCLSPSIQ